MRQLQSHADGSPTTTNQTHRECRGDTWCFLLTSVAEAGATCRINGELGGGETSFWVFPSSSSARRAEAPSLCFRPLLLFYPRHALRCLRCSPAARAAPTFLGARGPVARAASHARDSHLSEVRPRSPQKCRGRRPTARRRCHRGARVGPGEERSDRECSGKKKFFFFFLGKKKNRTDRLLHPRSSLLRQGLFSLSQLFQSVVFFFFSLPKAAPNRIDQLPVFRPAILTLGGGGLVAGTLRFSPASPPRGEHSFAPRFLSFFLLIFSMPHQW